jgi:hypothetical protein
MRKGRDAEKAKRDSRLRDWDNLKKCFSSSVSLSPGPAELAELTLPLIKLHDAASKRRQTSPLPPVKRGKRRRTSATASSTSEESDGDSDVDSGDDTKSRKSLIVRLEVPSGALQSLEAKVSQGNSFSFFVQSVELTETDTEGTQCHAAFFGCIRTRSSFGRIEDSQAKPDQRCSRFVFRSQGGISMLPFFTLLTSTSFLKLVVHYRSRKQAHLPNLNLISKLVSNRKNLYRDSLKHRRRGLLETVLPDSLGLASRVDFELAGVLRLPSNPFSSPPLLAARFESPRLRQSVLLLLFILIPPIATSKKLGVRSITKGHLLLKSEFSVACHRVLHILPLSNHTLVLSDSSACT